MGENLSNRQMLSRPESVEERAVGEDDTENSWRNSVTIIEHLYVWVLLRSRVKGWNMTRVTTAQMEITATDVRLP